MSDDNPIGDSAPAPVTAETEGKSPESSEDKENEKGASLYDVLFELCRDNIEFFAKDDTMNGSKIHAALLTLSFSIGIAKQRVETIQSFAHEYDYDEHTKANGYRSFVTVVDCCIRHSIKLCRLISEGRSSLLFRKAVYFKEVKPFFFQLAN